MILIRSFNLFSSPIKTLSPFTRSIMTQSNSESFKPVWTPSLYDKARPGYPREAIDKILANIDDSSSSSSSPSRINYVDLAAGTGIFTKLLINSCTNEKENKFKLNSIIAVEPSETMLNQLKSTLFDSSEGFISKLQSQGKLDNDIKTFGTSGLFDTIDLSNLGENLQGNIDLITIAQAWHWCEDWNGALNQISKVLKSGGILAIAWNLEDREKAKWVSLLRDSYEKYEGNSRQYRHNTWKEMYKTEAMKKFEILPEIHVHRNLPTTLQGVIDRCISKSYVGMQPKETQNEIIKHIKDIFANNSDETLQRKWIDKDQGIFEYPYATDVLLFRKK